MQIIKTADLPQDIQLLILEQEFKARETRLYTTTDFQCPTSYCDANCMTLIAYNRTSGESKAIRNGCYESHMCWTKEEHAMYGGKLKSPIPDSNTWFIVLDTYPKQRISVYCHPSAMARAIVAPVVELTRRQEIALFITRGIISSYRVEEARSFGIKKSEWETLKAELYGLGLMTKTGALTLTGKNRAQGLVFYAYQENKPY